MGGGAWPFLVGGRFVWCSDALRCSGKHCALYTDVFNESIALAERGRVIFEISS
ncbi:hypothetical protein Pint_30593 [Pistacia integerrima]|uniref:Uncharacterized protein n=1 Tax=Pistacia integerrima TaxID=434235 RepID=A0ACC0X243_9ROSI|nr:hypothetical protein Pint_30593 [Pistacia integerrima]